VCEPGDSPRRPQRPTTTLNTLMSMFAGGVRWLRWVPTRGRGRTDPFPHAQFTTQRRSREGTKKKKYPPKVQHQQAAWFEF
jgi:hypothetical protein